MKLINVAAISGFAASVSAWNGENDCPAGDQSGHFKSVAVFSVDGLHASDIDKWLAKGKSNISTMLNNGYLYSNAWTTFPSDSFPGTTALFTGGTPPTTGVWYDDVWDRSYWPPNSSCNGAPGNEMLYDETDDYNLNLLFSGGINPLNLPMAKINGKCVPLYPHQRLRVNTVFEAVVKSGLQTAYADKHPSYDLVRGPSGTGLTSGYFPEINSAADYTANVSQCIQWDQLHVNAFLNWMDSVTPSNSEGSISKYPALWGGNFQSVSVGEKTAGYVAGTLDFAPKLLTAIEYIDAAFGAIINKLKAKNLYQQTLMIVCSKHGQAPIDPTTFKEVNPANFTSAIGVNTTYITFDTIALVFLQNQNDLSTAVANLQAHKSDLRIQDIVYGQQMINNGWGNSKTDPAVPDIVVQPIPGTIYTTSTSKIAEHGGDSDDERHIACFAHNPNLPKMTFNQHVDTKQVAPTILQALGLRQSLQAVQTENTDVLPGFCGQGAHWGW